MKKDYKVVICNCYLWCWHAERISYSSIVVVRMFAAECDDAWSDFLCRKIDFHNTDTGKAWCRYVAMNGLPNSHDAQMPYCKPDFKKKK